MEDYPKICIIGGGFSGMCAGIQLEKRLGIKNYQIFEENSNFGGTWLSNKYPGSCCDIASHIYSFSFEPNPNWSSTFSSFKEIWDYQIRVATKYDLYKKASFNTRVLSMEWFENDNKWLVKTFDQDENVENDHYFDFVINCVGSLRMPKIPKEFSEFKGEKFHSAQWDTSIELDGKKVGIIGSGSSAIQIMPEIVSKVKELHSYQRKPAWVQPKDNPQYSPFWKRIFSNFPIILKIYRLYIFVFLELFHSTFRTGSYLNNLGKNSSLKFLAEQIPQNEKLRNALTPKYTFGCKRIVYASNYYPIFNLSNVTLHTENITKIENKSITTEDGNTQDLDVLILCTGFIVQEFFAPLKVIGKNGLDVGQVWKSRGPSTFYGIASNLIPNNFFLLGPNTVLGHSSVLYMIECQMDFTIKVLGECLKRGCKRVEIKNFAEKNWMDENKNHLAKMVWSTGCGAWYQNSDGNLTTLWAKNCYNYYKETKNVDLNLFEFN